MKSKNFLFVSISLLSILFLSTCSEKLTESIKSTPKLKNPVNLEKEETVINTYFKEVMRLGEINRIDLVAKKSKAPFYFDLKLIVDGIRYDVGEELTGYKPQLILAFIDDDELLDIKITIKSGKTDNSLFFKMFHFQKREFKSLSNDNSFFGIVPLKLTWYSDNMIQIQSIEYGINTKRVLSNLDPSLYKTNIGITGYKELKLIDIDKDGQFEIIGIQSIWLGFPYRKFLTFQSILKHSKNKWVLLEYSFLSYKS